MNNENAVYEIAESIFCRQDLQAMFNYPNVDMSLAIEKIFAASKQFVEFETEQIRLGATVDEVRVARAIFAKQTPNFYFKFDGSTGIMVRCFERAKMFREYMDDYRTWRHWAPSTCP